MSTEQRIELNSGTQMEPPWRKINSPDSDWYISAGGSIFHYLGRWAGFIQSDWNEHKRQILERRNTTLNQTDSHTLLIMQTTGMRTDEHNALIQTVWKERTELLSYVRFETNWKRDSWNEHRRQMLQQRNTPLFIEIDWNEHNREIIEQTKEHNGQLLEHHSSRTNGLNEHRRQILKRTNTITHIQTVGNEHKRQISETLNKMDRHSNRGTRLLAYKRFERTEPPDTRTGEHYFSLTNGLNEHNRHILDRTNNITLIQTVWDALHRSSRIQHRASRIGDRASSMGHPWAAGHRPSPIGAHPTWMNHQTQDHCNWIGQIRFRSNATANQRKGNFHGEPIRYVDNNYDLCHL